jgi:alpha-L-fucosidase 2
MNPPWDADYHLNINVQMNYWPAEVTNLAELHQPLFDFLETLREPGRKTAQAYYGAHGFVPITLPIFGDSHHRRPPSFWFVADGRGVADQHLWEHYRFGLDRAFLARAYPTMKEAAEFFLDYLVEDPRSPGRVVSGPSVSPENRIVCHNGHVGSSPWERRWIIRSSTACLLKSSNRARFSGSIASSVTEWRRCKRSFRHRRLESTARFRNGRRITTKPIPAIVIFLKLFALHPSDQITMRGTPELARAARATIERRLANGGGHTRWSRAWIINFWARLEDGEQAHANYQALLAKSTLRICGTFIPVSN